MENVIDLLRERGFIEQLTSEDLRDIAKKPLTVYCGFDPTSDSLHLGSLVAIMGLAWFEKMGHTPIALVGGATGMIGDPSGKRHERQLLDSELIRINVQGIQKNLEKFLDKPLLLNNYDWFSKMSLIEFLRDTAKHFRLGPMLGKESVRSRMDSEEGMSFTEFSYQLLQAYDFLHLYDKHNVTLQIGGSDQWGNITAGQELIRKLRGKSVFGCTFPLLTSSTGEKFGKTEKGAIWLSPEKCSPFEFYQYLVRIPDSDVISLLCKLTFLSMEEIKEIEHSMQQSSYVANAAQKRLASEVTRLVHGQEALDIALKVTNVTKPGQVAILDASILETITQDMPSKSLPKNEVVGGKIIDLFAKTKLQPSKSEARRLIKSGGAYLNNQKVHDESRVVFEEDLVDGKMILLGAGKKSRVLIKIY